MDGQMSIFDFPEFLPGEKNDEPKSPAEIWAEQTGISDYWSHDIVFVDDKPVCKHSNHSCNRKELWNIAMSFDDITCPQQCCRKCDVRLCGARCNGSEEPKAVPVEIKGICDDGYCPKCNVFLDDLIEKCPYCGTLLDWTHWKIINDMED